MCAAQQLMSFGFDVVVVEARNRVGGRVHTEEFDGVKLDRECLCLEVSTLVFFVHAEGFDLET